MKKFLSVLLAVMMVLSTVSFAAPSLADVADTAVEAPVEEAVLASDTEAGVNYIATFEFNDSKAPFNADIVEDTDNGGYKSSNTAMFRGALISQETVDGVGAVKIDLGSTNFNTAKYGDINAGGALEVVASPNELTKIQIRFKVADYTFDEGASPIIRFYPWHDGTVVAGYGIRPTVTTKDEDGWYVYEGDMTGSNFVNGNLTNVQFGFEGVTAGPSYDANTVFYIDYIRFVGLPTQELALDMGTNTEATDTTVDVTAVTTVATVLNKIVVPATSSYAPVGLKTTSGTVLASTDLVAAYDELVVVWQKYDDFGFDFDTAWAAGTAKVGGGTAAAFLDDSTVDADEGETGTYAKLVYSTNKEDTETTKYGIRADRGRIGISNINIPAGELEKMVIKLRFKNIPADCAYIPLSDGTETSPLSFDADGNQQYSFIWQAGGLYKQYTMPTDGSWMYLVLDKNTAATRTDVATVGNILGETGISSFRFDFPAGPQGLTVEVDDIVFLGQPVYDATLVMDAATAPAEKASYTKVVEFNDKTTADQLVSEVVTSDYFGTKMPVAVKIGGTVYTGSAVVGDLITTGDEITVVWGEMNILAGKEFNSADDLMTDSECNAVVKDGVLKLTRTAAGEIYLGFSTDLNVADVDDIQVRLRYVGNGLTDTKTTDYWFVAWDGNYVNNGINYPVDDGEWVTLSFKNNIGGSIADVKSASSKITSFRTPHFDADVMPIGSSIEIDFVRVLGFPAQEVEVDAGELGTLTGKYTKNTTVKQFVESLEYPVSDKVVTGIVGAEDTDLVADVVENGTLTAVLGDNVWFGEYGVKVWSVDFDDATVGATLAREVAFTDIGADINPSFNAAIGTLKLQLQGTRADYADPTVTVEGTDSDKYIKFVAGAAGGTNVIMAYCNQFYSTDDGHYVLSYDLKTPDTGKATTVQFNRAHQIEEGAHKVVYDLTENEWGTVVGYYPKNERYSNSDGTVHLDTIKEINIIKLAGKNTVAGDELYFDNITLWWLPKSVEVDVVVGDENAEAEDATFAVSPAGTTAGDLAAKVYGGKKTVAGLALTAGGDALDADKPLILTGDTTLYVTGWDDVSYLEEWGAEFDTDTGYSALTFAGTEWNDGWADIYGTGNTYGEDYITWNEDGYITMSYDVLEADKTAAGSATPVVYDSVLYIDGLDGTPESHAESFVKAGSVKAIQFRYRFTGDIVAKDDEVYYGGAVKTATAAFAPYLYVWSSGESAKQYNALPEITTSGEWVIATVAAADLKLDVNDLYVLRLDVPDCMPAGATFDVDYIRFLGDTAEAPTTLSAATALRENKAGETYNNAIRFMATVNAVTKTRATDIGWLVSTEAYLGSDELTYDKYVAGSNKVKVAYQKQNGADAIANYFNTEDDDANVFAAFLYNIPEENALDNVVVRPFVKSGSKYLYGEEVVTNLYTMLNIDAYITLDPYFSDINAMVAEASEWGGYAGLVEYEQLKYNEAYTALDDAEKQAYITAVLTALLG